MEDLGSIPELGRSSGEGKGYPLQYSGLEDSMDWRIPSPWGRKELDMTERLSLSLIFSQHFHRRQIIIGNIGREFRILNLFHTKKN